MPIRQRKARTAIDDEAIRFLGQASSDPGRALVLSQTRHLLSAMGNPLEELARRFDLFASQVQRQEVMQRHWRSEAQFMGFTLAGRPVRGVALTYREEWTQIQVRSL